VTPYPGANRDDVLSTLREISSALQNAGNVHAPAQARLNAYLEWVTDSIRMLEHRLSSADIDRLVLTRSYDRLLAAAGTFTGTDIGTQRVLNGLVSHEVQQRLQTIEDAIGKLRAQILLWPQDFTYIVADTSVYIEHDNKLRDLDFAPLLPGSQDKPVLVIVPIIVLGELDGLKLRSGGGEPPTRSRSLRTSFRRRVPSAFCAHHPPTERGAQCRWISFSTHPNMSGCPSTMTRSSTAPWLRKASLAHR